MRVLIVTTEPVPLPGCMTTGAGLRAWGLVQGLRCRGIGAEVAMPRDALGRYTREQREAASDWIFDRDRLTDHVRDRHPDVLVMQHWGLMDRLGAVGCPLAIDLAGPHLLERRFWESPSPDLDLAQKMAALGRADFLTCSGRYQRHYFLPFALQAGFDPTDPGLLPVIPYSVSPELPEPADHDALDFVYTGLFLPWQDPAVAIDSVLSVLDRREAGRLVFVGAAHPAGDVSRGRFEKVLFRLGRSPRAIQEPARPYEDLVALLVRCGAALDLMAWNSERELAFTSRTVVYLSCGLPVLYNDYSELSDYIYRYDAGWTLDPQDGGGIETLVEGLVADPGEIERRRENARRLVRENLTWDRTIEPLAVWCENPVRREGKGVKGSGQMLSELQVRLEASETARREMEGRRLVKLSNFIRGLRG
ncbi:glycosyltransferase family 4 protein [bacterium]|nr:glycosyltransferase family 4 protein [bacterium]